jgi:hypothetical protein
MPAKNKNPHDPQLALNEMQETVRRLSRQVAHLEQRAHETHDRADKAHKKAEQLHYDSTVVRKRAQADTSDARTTRRKQRRSAK